MILIYLFDKITEEIASSCNLTLIWGGVCSHRPSAELFPKHGCLPSSYSCSAQLWPTTQLPHTERNLRSSLRRLFPSAPALCSRWGGTAPPLGQVWAAVPGVLFAGPPFVPPHGATTGLCGFHPHGQGGRLREPAQLTQHAPPSPALTQEAGSGPPHD